MTEKGTAAKERNLKAPVWKTWYQPDVKIQRVRKMKKRKEKRKGIDALERLAYLGSLTEGAFKIYALLSERLHDRRPVRPCTTRCRVESGGPAGRR